MKISTFLKTSKSLFLTQYSLMLEYRAEITLWALSGILPLIMLGIWLGSDSLKETFSDQQYLFRYFISAFVVRQFTAVWVMISFEEDQIEGKLSSYLMHPIAPFWRYFFAHIAEQVSRVPIVMIMLISLFIFIPGSFWVPTFPNIIISILTILWAFTIRFLLHWTFSMLCFWNERISSIERLLLIPYIFLSGLVAPIEFLPRLLKYLAFITPFPYIIYYPSCFLANNYSGFQTYLIISSIWTFLLIILSFYAWKLGIKKYSAMGA